MLQNNLLIVCGNDTRAYDVFGHEIVDQRRVKALWQAAMEAKDITPQELSDKAIHWCNACRQQLFCRGHVQVQLEKDRRTIKVNKTTRLSTRFSEPKAAFMAHGLLYIQTARSMELFVL